MPRAPMRRRASSSDGGVVGSGMLLHTRHATLIFDQQHTAAQRAAVEAHLLAQTCGRPCEPDCPVCSGSLAPTSQTTEVCTRLARGGLRIL